MDSAVLERLIGDYSGRIFTVEEKNCDHCGKLLKLAIEWGDIFAIANGDLPDGFVWVAGEGAMVSLEHECRATIHSDASYTPKQAEAAIEKALKNGALQFRRETDDDDERPRYLIAYVHETKRKKRWIAEKKEQVEVVVAVSAGDAVFTWETNADEEATRTKRKSFRRVEMARWDKRRGEWVPA